MDKIALSCIRTKYAGKQVLKGRRKKHTTATVVDADYLFQKERKAEEKERAEEESVKGNAARKVARVQSASGGSRVGRGRGRREAGKPANIGK